MARIGQRPPLRVVATVVGGAILLAYLVALPGPLRVDTDAGYYLELGASLADGTGLHPPGSQSLPPGYPVLIAGLDVLGIAGAASLAGLALCFLALALAAIAVVGRVDLGLTDAEIAVVLVATALSVYVVKYVYVPASEIPFLGVACAALAALSLARRRASVPWLLAGAALVGVACTIRVAGVALGAAIVLAPAQRALRRAAAVAVAACAAVVVVVAPYALRTDKWTDEPLATALDETWRFFVTSGSVASNTPISAWKSGVMDATLAPFGVAVVALVGWALWSRRGALRPVDGFVVGTLGIILVFPWEHPRFYLPVVPFVAAYAVLAARRLPRLGRAALAVFALVGVVGLAYSALLAWSGDAFPERYAGGELAPTYRVAWGAPRPGDAERVARRELAALRRYDPDPPWGWSGAP